MKNNKGFSLVEIIAVITILTLLMVMAVPTVTRLLSKNKEKAYNSKIETIFKQAKQYARDNESFLYSNSGSYGKYVCNTITVGQLKNAGYLKELDEEGKSSTILDPRTKQSMENKVIMVYIQTSKTSTGTDVYKGNLVATDKNTSRCNISNAGFSYSGREEVFTANQTGVYKIEAWGGEGASYDGTYRGGYGAYAYGEVTLTAGEKLYINVGGEGKKTIILNEFVAGGYNGGGATVTSCGTDENVGGSGGGASSVALKSGLLKTLSGDVDKVLLVAAGGGGAGYCASNTYGTGGNGGGISGNPGTGRYQWDNYSYGTGATQTAAGCRANGDACGKFGTSNDQSATAPFTGGGGGFYGGGTGRVAGGGGGSSYIGNSRLTNKGMYCHTCTTSDDVNTKTVSGSCTSKTPEANCAKLGTGYVIISYLGAA